MHIVYESRLQKSIYDQTTYKDWFSVTRYYDLSNPLDMSMEYHHAHTEAEIMYVVEGKGTVILEGGEEIILRRGNFIFFDSLVPHRFVVDNESPYRILNLEAKLTGSNSNMRFDILMEDDCFKGFITDSLPVFSGYTDEPAINSGIKNLHRLLRLKAAPVAIDMQLSCILLEIGRQHYLSTKNRKLSAYAYVKRALKYIAENYDQDISIDSVADAAMISKSHLQRVFRELEGVTIVEEINRLRLKKAKSLLKSSNMPIIDVAVEVGFSSRQYFTDLFTRKNGCSPSRYRKRHIEDNIVSGHAYLHEDLNNELSKNKRNGF